MKEKNITEEEVLAVCKDPVEKKVVLLYEMASAMDVLMRNIDRHLRKIGYSFDKEKKMLFGRLTQSIKDVTYWYERLGIDDTVLKAVGGTLKGFDNYLADSNEMIRFLMMYVDRSITENGFESIYRFMSNLPDNGVFGDDALLEFKFDRPYKFDIGDRVKSPAGYGKIVGRGNDGNWVVKLDEGREKIIHENSIEIV